MEVEFMKEFDAEEYYDDLVRYVEGYRELTQRAEFVSQYLAKADDTMLYTVSHYFDPSYDCDFESENESFTESAFLLAVFYAYEKSAVEYFVYGVTTGDFYEKLSEAVIKCETSDFSFAEYLLDFRGDFSFLVEDSFTVQSKFDKGNIKENQENYKNKKIDYDLKTIAKKLYGNDTEWIFKNNS